jgi:undecaprenyl diphosphate synthase
MSQSTSLTPIRSRMHVAIIMDGNGRWAQGRGWPRLAGHRAGAEAVRRIVEAARRMEFGTLTLYAFSSDNWRRPPSEVASLMRLFRQHLISETQRCVANGIRLSVIGRRDRLPDVLIGAIEEAEAATEVGSAMHLRVAVDYSARDTLVRAAARAAGQGPVTRERLERCMAEVNHDPADTPEVDLLIRTGGEQRLSDFLLWECAYGELYFTERMWPDFEAADLERALEEFKNRERRFGAVSSMEAKARRAPPPPTPTPARREAS